jgi:hypothetical protein
MAKLAIDIVLLPSEEMMNNAVDLNKKLLKINEPKIVLHKESCLPHISLCMGCIDEDNIPEIKHRLHEISSDFTPLRLQAINLEAEIIPTGKKVSVLQISKKDDLQKLHETTMKKMWDLLSYDVEISMLFNPPEVEDVTLYWIREYAKKYDDPLSFDPHITIGFGETNASSLPIDFRASEIAMCHLGNYCTCRKVILSSELG